MSKAQDNPKWLFIHIMKTAGTSFRTLLEESLGTGVYPTRSELDQLPKEWYPKAARLLELIEQGHLDLADRHVLCGHYSPSLAKQLPGTWRIACFLREPLQRSISMISHRLRYQPMRPRSLMDRITGNRVDRLLQDKTFLERQITNYQTKILAAPALRDVNRAQVVNQKSFSQAMRALERMDFIGLSERFGESVQVFEDISGITLKRQTLRANPGTRIHLNEAQTERIRSLIQYDLRLYQEATAHINSHTPDTAE